MSKVFLRRPLAAAIALSLLCPLAVLAAENAAEDKSQQTTRYSLDTVVVQGRRSLNEDVITDQKNRAVIAQEMVRDTRDLVRYTTDVGISDSGRHLKGFAIRGVEGNRVGISVDGVSLPDFEENSLYSRYGNFNSSRMSIDPELVRAISIVKGADAFSGGSGALGGRVDYRTLEAGDIVRAGNETGFLLRSGYASKNREWVNGFAVGYAGDAFETLLVYSHRHGHEMDSRGEGPYYQQSKSQHPDPSRRKQDSYLAKLRWHISPAHSLSLGVTGQLARNFTDERSYTLFGSQWREAEDISRRGNLQLGYAWTPESDLLASVKLDGDYQRTDLSAFNYKGGRNYTTHEKELGELFDRRMHTRFKRLTLGVETLPLALGASQHTLAFKAFAANREFWNINYDTYVIRGVHKPQPAYAIQYPVDTRQYGFSLEDRVQWSPALSSRFGLRYDHERLTPQELNAPCSKACTAEGRPAGNTFGNWNGLASVVAKLNAHWALGATVSTGYRVPTASEMYFTFKNAYGSWKSNPDLRAERSVNYSLSLQGEGEAGGVNISLYQVNYRDFLFEQETITRTRNPYYEQCQAWGCAEYDEAPVQQMVNLDRARIRGLEFSSHLNLAHYWPQLEGWKLSAQLGYSKGSLSSDNSLLSIQPLKGILGLDYHAPNGRWAVFARGTYLGAKKAADAQVVQNVYSYRNRTFSRVVTTYPYLNRRAALLDIYGYVRAGERLTFRAGVYNIFNRKYHTWDALRGINAHYGASTTNSVDREGYGLERFHAPGRNFSLSMEYLF
ncbi:MAG: TonB-dependent hemoglobin/transferrin/lactoferrin family receptor [Pseudomonadota bacterium]|nr:TonB-dependent hemoglobin/transferrin/lactoferrin family receptor [Pseudomonadota bacterium]